VALGEGYRTWAHGQGFCAQSAFRKAVRSGASEPLRPLVIVG
jgi:hypothetical protein